MKSIPISFFCVLQAFFSSSCYSNEPYIKWVGDFYVNSVSSSAPLQLQIVRKFEYLESGQKVPSKDKIEYTLKCHKFSLFSPEGVETFKFGYSNFYISLSETSDVRFSVSSEFGTDDPDLIARLFKSSSINFYLLTGEKIGSLTLNEITAFLEKNNSIISECKENLAKSVENIEREQQELAERDELNREKYEYEKRVSLIKQGVVFLLFALLGLYLIQKIIRNAPSVLIKVKEGFRGAFKIISERNDKKFEKDMEKKVIETVIAEIVRQSVKQAITKGVDPNKIVVCTTCKGSGCDSCGQKGWLVDH